MCKIKLISFILVAILGLSGNFGFFQFHDFAETNVSTHITPRSTEELHEFVNLESVEVVPNLTEGESMIHNVDSIPGQHELICGTVKGTGKLGDTNFSTNGSIFLRFRSSSLNLDLVSNSVEGYYEEDTDSRHWWLYPMEYISMDSCKYRDGFIILVGSVRGHHEFHESNISSPYRTLDYLNLEKYYPKYIWIFDVENNSSTASYFASQPIKSHISVDGEIIILTRIAAWPYNSDYNYKMNGTLDKEFLRGPGNAYHFGLMKISRNGELISYDNLTDQMMESKEVCSIDWLKVEFDDYRKTIHFIGNTWVMRCEVKIENEIIRMNNSYVEAGWLFYFTYSWELRNWTSVIVRFVETIQQIPGVSFFEYGTITASPQGVIISINRFSESLPMRILGENFTEDANGELFLIKLDSELSHIETELIEFEGDLFPSRILMIDNTLVLGGSFCWRAALGENCTLEIDSQHVERSRGWDAFIATQNNNGTWNHLSAYGAGNLPYNYDTYPFSAPSGGSHEFPQKMQAIGNIGFLAVMRFHEEVEYAGTTIPAKQSAIFRFHFDSDLDGQRDEIDNCDDVQNPSQDNLDNDEFGDFCDSDIDGDTISNEVDACPHGETNWLSDSNSDIDRDGCRDSSEDEDDDNDLITDNIDNCVETHNPNQLDYDEDGQGDSCDSDIDDDGVSNQFDSCPGGVSGWSAYIETDRDEDGCQDSSEDLDDDNDGITDSEDSCPRGAVGWNPSRTNDLDQDGCLDSVEDSDDDGDGIPDFFDDHPRDATRWIGLRYTILISISALVIIGYTLKERSTEERVFPIDDSEE